ncbi:MAG: hypothetical protein R3293_18685 [Candidatus Promineifilaceae bacterium]|nr:hypothetical protein [Candidatus Promineifilaceae bacterium]
MSKKVKIAILRAYNDSSMPISDQACRDMLMTGPRSLLRYWRDNTDRYLDFVDSAMLPWVNIMFTAADINFDNLTVSRHVQVAKAYQATKALNNNQELHGYDGFVVITAPGAAFSATNPATGAAVMIGFDSGAGAVANGKPACALPVSSSDLTFMCHELGHVLGFKHTYGVWNNGMDWDGAANGWIQGQEYGDPYDIMSSASFGTRSDPSLSRYSGQPQFAGSSPAGWPIGPNIGMGPGASLANVDFWDSSALRSGTIRHLQTPANGTHSVRLYAAGSLQGSPRLIAIHPANEDNEGRGRCYIEYRDTAGWDEGLDLAGNDLARQAVVVHTLADAPDAGVRCWYRGRILVPVEIDSDLAVTGTPLVVRVTDGYVDYGYVDLEISTGTTRGVDINVMGDDALAYGNNINEMGTPCGDQIVYADWVTQSTYFYHAISYGYGGEGAPDALAPRIAWTVGGAPVPAGSGQLNISTAEGMFTVDYAVDAVTAELTLVSRAGERYRAAVVATATEANGSSPTTANTFFEPLGYFSGFRPGDLGVLDRCMRKYMLSARLKPYELLIPPGPDPYRAQWRDRINMLRMQEAVQRIAIQYPQQASALQQMAALRYRHL